MGTNEAGFDWFFAREYGPVVRSLALALGDRDAAEEAAQEAFSRAFAHWSKLERTDRPEAWVFVVAMRYERRRSLRTLRRPSLPPPPAVPDQAVGVADRALLVSLLDALTERQRRAVVLRYDADLTLAQTAEALGCTVGTVKATLNHAMERLRTKAGKESLHAAC